MNPPDAFDPDATVRKTGGSIAPEIAPQIRREPEPAPFIASTAEPELPADAQIRELAAPNYYRQWQAIAGRLKVIRIVGAVFVYAALVMMSGAIVSGFSLSALFGTPLDASDGGGFLKGPIFPGSAPGWLSIVGTGILFAIILIILYGVVFVLAATPPGRLVLQSGAAMLGAINRALGLRAARRAAWRIVGRFVPQGIKTRLENRETALLDRFLPGESPDLDPDMLAKFPKSQFPELYASVPLDLRVSPLIDGRAPNGDMPLIFTRRIISRLLAFVAIKKGITGALAVAVVLVLVNLATLPAGAINAARTAVFNHDVESFNASYSAQLATWQASENAWQKQEQAKEQGFQADVQSFNTKVAAYNKWRSDKVNFQQNFQRTPAYQAWADRRTPEWQAWSQEQGPAWQAWQMAYQQYQRAVQNWQDILNHHDNWPFIPIPAGAKAPVMPNEQLYWPPAPAAQFSEPEPPNPGQFTETNPIANDIDPNAATRPQQQQLPDDLQTPPQPIGFLSMSSLMTLDVFGIGTILLVLSVVPLVSVRRAEEVIGGKYRIQTKQALVRWNLNRTRRERFLATYRRQIKHANGWLKAKPVFSPLFTIGTATGDLKAAGAYAAPEAGVPMCLDGESLFQNILVTGGIGDGKTTSQAIPLARQFLTCPTVRYGILGLDAKGVLWRDLKKLAESAGRGDDVVVIGPAHTQVNPIAGLDAQGFSFICRALLTQSGGTGGTAFFRDQAALVLGHAAMVAKTLNRGNLRAIYEIAAIDSTLKEACGRADDLLKENPQGYPGLAAALSFLIDQYYPMVAETKNGVRGEIANLLDAAVSDPTLAGFVGAGFSEGTAIVDGSIQDSLATWALDGKIVLTAMSSSSGGIGGRLILMCLKSTFFRAAKLRQEEHGTEYCQTKPCIVICDEAQELVSAGSSSDGLSDSTFFNTSRSSSVGAVFLTQGYSALTLALGAEATANLTEQFRTKIFLRCEDRATAEEINRLAGKYLRTPVFEAGHYESIADWESETGRVYLDNAKVEQAEAVRFIMNASASEIMRIERSVDQNLAAKSIYTPLVFAETKAKQNDQGPHTNFEERNYQQRLRAEDLSRSWLKDGNEQRDAVDDSDIQNWGRWHALALCQRAGAARIDIVSLEHFFG